MVFSFLVIFFSQQSFSKIIYVLDFDGTITNDSEENSAWRSDWYLVRIDKLHTALQPMGAINARGELEISLRGQAYVLPQYLPLSYREVNQHRTHFGKGDRLLGTLSPYALAPDLLGEGRPSVFIPGYYRISEDVSFWRYRPGRLGANYLLEDAINAKAREDQSKGRLEWRGRAFPLLQAALSSPETVGNLIVNTVRGNSDSEFNAFFDWLKDNGEIAHSVGLDHLGRETRPVVKAHGRPESILLGREDGAGLKNRVLRRVAHALTYSTANRHLDLLPAGNSKNKNLVYRPTHTLIVAENDPVFLEAQKLLLAELSSEYEIGQKVKFVLYDATDAENFVGKDSERWTVFHRHQKRVAKPEEVKLWLGKAKRQQCAQALASEEK